LLQIRLKPPGLLLPAFLFLLVMGLVEGVVYAYKQALFSEQRLEALAYAADLRARSERELARVLQLTSGLTGYFAVNSERPEPQEIQDILRLVYETGPSSLRNLGLAKGYKLTYVYPLERNRAAIGLDYRELEAQWPAVEQAIESRQPQLSEMVNLVQGGRAFIYRDPIYVDDEYWGLLSTVVDAEPLLEDMFGGSANQSYKFAVRSLNHDRPMLLWGEASLFKESIKVVAQSDRGWEYVVCPIESDSHWLPVFMLRILGWILALIAVLFSYSSIMGHRHQAL